MESDVIFFTGDIEYVTSPTRGQEQEATEPVETAKAAEKSGYFYIFMC